MKSADLTLSCPQPVTAQILVRMISLADRTDQLMPALFVATGVRHAAPLPPVQS